MYSYGYEAVAVIINKTLPKMRSANYIPCLPSAFLLQSILLGSMAQFLPEKYGEWWMSKCDKLLNEIFQFGFVLVHTTPQHPPPRTTQLHIHNNTLHICMYIMLHWLLSPSMYTMMAECLLNRTVYCAVCSRFLSYSFTPYDSCSGVVTVIVGVAATAPDENWFNIVFFFLFWWKNFSLPDNLWQFVFVCFLCYTSLMVWSAFIAFFYILLHRLRGVKQTITLDMFIMDYSLSFHLTRNFFYDCC